MPDDKRPPDEPSEEIQSEIPPEPEEDEQPEPPEPEEILDEDVAQAIADDDDGEALPEDEFAEFRWLLDAPSPTPAPPKFTVIQGGLSQPASPPPGGAGASAGSSTGAGAGGSSAGGSDGSGGGPPPDGALPRFNIPHPKYTADVVLDPEFATKTWPAVEPPDDLFKVKLRSDMYPSDGFIGKYLEWMEPTTDAPRAFHLATALVILSTAIGRTYRIAHGATGGGLYSNLFFLLLADSGSRKSTAMRPARALLSPTRLWTGPHASSLSFTESLAVTPTVLWQLDEATSLLELFKTQSSGDLLEKMNTAYCGDEVWYRSNKQGKISVPFPHVNLITATPLAWLREKQLSEDFLRGGTFARFTLVPAAPDGIKIDPPPPDPDVQIALTRWLDGVAALNGSFTIELEHKARQEYAAYVANRGQCEDLLLSGVWNRAGDMVKKLSLLYHIACMRPAKQRIQLDTVRQAIAFVHEFALPGHLWATGRLRETSPIRRHQMTLEEELLQRPAGMRYRDVSVQLGVSIRESDMVLAGLFESQRIAFWTWKENGPEWRGRPEWVVGIRGRTPVRAGYCVRAPESDEDFAPARVERILTGADAGYDLRPQPAEPDDDSWLPPGTEPL